jgi:hypothetical protein
MALRSKIKLITRSRFNLMCDDENLSFASEMDTQGGDMKISPIFPAVVAITLL